MNPQAIPATAIGSICLVPILLVSLHTAVQAQGSRADYQRAQGFRKLASGKFHLNAIKPTWFAQDRKMWYLREVRGTREFVLVDCVKGTRKPVFDHQGLAAGLSKASKRKIDATKLPIRSLVVNADVTELRFSALGSKWQCKLSDYLCRKSGKAESPPAPSNNRRNRGRRGSRNRSGSQRNRGKSSPDGQWEAFERNHDLYLKPKDEGTEVRLTKDGKDDHAYAVVSWAPDSKTLLAVKTKPGKIKDVPLIESSPADQLTAKFRTRSYARPGDQFPHHDLILFKVAEKKPIPVKTPTVDSRERGSVRPRWSKDGQTFTFERKDRGHKRFRIHEVDVATGETSSVLDENTVDYKAGDTFVNSWGQRIQYLEKSGKILFTSERDGWKHIYLQGMKAGSASTQVTKGNWVVRNIDRVDEDKKVIWFQASGMVPGQDPYFLHYYRINFDGSGLVTLTEGDGTHQVAYSPKREYLVDTWSRADLPPESVLRRVADGKLVCKLEQADISELLATGWKLPEPFHAKGRDGKTDIWGIIYRPSQFDPNTRYPIIEDIYAGPHDSHVSKTFSATRSQQALAELGFIVVKIDGMGTSNRSKAFHDVCWQNVGGAGLPDRILWIKAAAKKYPYMDTSRVGIFGTSAGGQSSTGALLFHPDFYKVAVSACGCHDNRLDKASWNEQWMGYPVGPHYAAQSNIDNAHKLQDKLFLIVGELDTNVPPESTMRVVDALIKANKDFDLLVIPGAGHTSGGRYGNRRRYDFFVQHLHGKQPRWE